MAIRRLDKRNRFDRGDRSLATVSTLPTVKAMVDCFEKYLNLTIADGHASEDTVKTYRSRVHQFLSWCRERELYPALVTKQNVLEYRKHLVDGEKRLRRFVCLYWPSNIFTRLVWQRNWLRTIPFLG